ncbi:MAG: hypothetical protein ACRDBX_00125 [Erysipelotrichaceae bacterium]
MSYATVNKLEINVKLSTIKEGILALAKQHHATVEEQGRRLRFDGDTALTYAIVDFLSESTYRGSVAFDYVIETEESTTVATLFFQDGELIEEDYDFQTKT